MAEAAAESLVTVGCERTLAGPVGSKRSRGRPERRRLLRRVLLPGLETPGGALEPTREARVLWVAGILVGRVGSVVLLSVVLLWRLLAHHHGQSVHLTLTPSFTNGFL
jgi:hypothetical protein